MIILLLSISSFTLVFYTFMLLTGDVGFSKPVKLSTQPMVSILISLRNEEKNVESLCQSLTALNYPVSKVEILFGDDASNDNTLKLLRANRPLNASIYEFLEEGTGKYGKLKVLKELSAKAKGDFLFFTDADMILNPNWIQGMLHEIDDKPKICTGITVVKGYRLFHQLQNMDWLINQYLIAWAGNFLGPITAWGNNMAISRQSFEQVGGYHNIQSSIVEDVSLMGEIKRVDGAVTVLASKKNVCVTSPCASLVELLHQRARWMKGAKQVSFLIKLGMVFRLVNLPIVFLLFLSNAWFLLLMPVKMILQCILIKKLSTRVGTPFSWQSALYFEFYELIAYCGALILTVLPLNILWKGRIY